jgi:hypothetical protein
MEARQEATPEQVAPATWGTHREDKNAGIEGRCRSHRRAKQLWRGRHGSKVEQEMTLVVKVMRVGS